MELSTDANPLRVAICEDMAQEADVLILFVKESQIPVEIKHFWTGELNGVQVAELIREVDSQVVIVFTTTSEDYTREGYRLNAYKYMIKPIRYEDILDSLELATIKRDRAQGATVQIVCDGEPVTLAQADIVFVEASNRRSIFKMTDGSEYATITTIDALEKILPAPRFLRSHRAFIVNLDHVVDVDEDFVMDNGMRAYIRVKDFRKIKHAYDDYLFNSMRSDV